jgi:hypothetical protein
MLEDNPFSTKIKGEKDYRIKIKNDIFLKGYTM